MVPGSNLEAKWVDLSYPAVFHRMSYGHFKEAFYLIVEPPQLNFQTVLLLMTAFLPKADREWAEGLH